MTHRRHGRLPLIYYSAGVTWRGEGHQSRPQKILRLVRTFVAQPLVVCQALPGEIRQRYEHEHRYQANSLGRASNMTSSAQLGLAQSASDVEELMVDIAPLLAAKGGGFGANSYGWYADADSSLCRAAWCAVLHTRPKVVIETGVAHGVTSRIVLEALRQVDRGHLWSIDLPFPFDSQLHADTGAAVTDDCRPRWSYLEGSSRQRLPRLVEEVGHVELFIHDSLHTAKNTLFEMNQVASAMPPGGVMVVDDIGIHTGFATFARQASRIPDHHLSRYGKARRGVRHRSPRGRRLGKRADGEGPGRG